MPEIADLLADAVRNKASDLQLMADLPHILRINGEVMIQRTEPLSAESIRQMASGLLSAGQRAELADVGDVDIAYALPTGERFRINIYRQRGTVAVVARVVPSHVPKLADLGVPAAVADFVRQRRGLVLITGATGSGKSTTLAALIDLVNEERRCHIVTIEDPVEFMHDHRNSVISQRQVGEDTRSFADALRHVLRQAPDLILIGEMRDLETTSLALTAAETGHLVLATLHTNDAVQTMDRIIDIFPATQQDQVRQQLAATLVGVLCQQLIRRKSGDGRVMASEVLVASPAVRNLIREGKTFQLRSIIQTGQQQGLHTLEQSLARLVKQGEIDRAAALEVCNDREDLEHLLARSEEG